MKKLNRALIEEMLKYIVDFQREQGRSPGIRQIQKDLRLSSASVVRRYLGVLESEGQIQKNGAGNIALPDNLEGGEYVQVPIFGKIACGAPIEALENYAGSFALPKNIFGHGEMFMLYAEGYSMIDIGVSPGDLVVIKRQPIAENGQVVAAMTVDYEVTLKTFYNEGTHIRLHPENREDTDYKDILVNDCTILGVAVKIIKNI